VGRLVSYLAPSGPTTVPKLRQFTFTGDANDAAISPDGKTIAYLADSNSSLVVEDVSGGGRAMLARTTRWMRLPKWSRDGTRLLYSEGNISDFRWTGLIAVPRLGGARHDHSPGEGILLSGPGAYEFGADDTTLIVGFSTDSGSTNWVYVGATPESIRRISADSASATGRLFRMRGESWREKIVGQFRLSPDGRWLAFAANGNTGLTLGLMQPSGSIINMLLAVTDSLGNTLNVGLAWAPDGSALYYTQMAGATGAVMRQAIDPKRGVAQGKPVTVFENLPAPSALSLAADGTRLGMVGGFDRSHLVLVRLGVPSGARPVLTRFSCGTAACFPGSISPDKQIFAYTKSATSGDQLGDLYLREVSGAVERKLAAGVPKRSVAFTADSRELAFLSTVGDSQTLVGMDVASGRNRKLWRGNRVWGVFRLDQKTRGWGVLRHGGLTLVGDSLRRVSTPDSTHYWVNAVVSPDGLWAAVQHWGREGTGVYRVELATGREAPLITGQDRLPFNWSEDGRIYLLRSDTISGAALSVESMPADGGVLRTLTVFPSVGRIPLCFVGATAMSDDGEMALCLEFELNSDVYIVDDFGAGRR